MKMKPMTKMNRVREALKDPEIIALMRKDPEFAEYFNSEGNLTVDLEKPGVIAQVAETIMFHLERRKL